MKRERERGERSDIRKSATVQRRVGVFFNSVSISYPRGTLPYSIFVKS